MGEALLRGWYFRFSEKRFEGASSPESWHLLSSFSLHINWRPELGEAANQSRLRNIRKACGILDGVFLRPGDIFSMQRWIGDTEARDFETGPMVFRGRTILTHGGGICLVSTLVFNGALTAGLDILEKHNHSIDLWGKDRFVDLGRDATYVFARKDLKVRNSLNGPVLLRLFFDENERMIRCNVYSDKPAAQKMEIRQTIVREIPFRRVGDALGKGEKGWVVRVERFSCAGDMRSERTYKKTERYAPFCHQTD
jgi:vancomycin resistance protein VanW